jgi:hypothetical protein
MTAYQKKYSVRVRTITQTQILLTQVYILSNLPTLF